MPIVSPLEEIAKKIGIQKQQPVGMAAPAQLSQNTVNSAQTTLPGGTSLADIIARFGGGSGSSGPATNTQSNIPGGGQLSNIPIPSNPKKPDETFAAITKREQDRLEKLFFPVEDEVIGSLDNRSIVDTAREDATEGFDNLQARSDRSLRRFGVQLSPLQQQEFERGQNRGRALTFDTAVNAAELEQRNRNDSLRRELINIGRGVASEASSTFADASGLQAQREANNRTAKAQNKAQNIQTLGTLAAAAILFL